MNPDIFPLADSRKSIPVQRIRQLCIKGGILRPFHLVMYPDIGLWSGAGSKITGGGNGALV